jgi:hypothetical protein
MITSLPWPLHVIDFEASSLDVMGYPIEVGVAQWGALGEPIRGWSTLIRPTDDWTRNGHWSSSSAKVHGLRGRDLLADGWAPERVARSLNDMLGPQGIAWCDGGPYDAHWMRALFRAAGVEPRFILGDWHRLASMLGKTERDLVFDWLERQPTRHRARADAEQLLLALAHAAGSEVGPVHELEQNLSQQGKAPCGG